MLLQLPMAAHGPEPVKGAFRQDFSIAHVWEMQSRRYASARANFTIMTSST